SAFGRTGKPDMAKWGNGKMAKWEGAASVPFPFCPFTFLPRSRQMHIALYLFLAAGFLFLGSHLLFGQEEARELLHRAQQAESEGHYAEAAGIYEDLVSRNPGSPELLNDLGVVYTRMGKYPEAIVAYQKALKFDPHSASLLA